MTQISGGTNPGFPAAVSRPVAESRPPGGDSQAAEGSPGGPAGILVVRDEEDVTGPGIPRVRTGARGGAAAAASDHAVATALRAAIEDNGKLPDLLDVLSEGRLWVPLPDDGTRVTDGSSLTLPTVTYLGGEFVPAFTSAGELTAFVARPDPGAPPPVVPHVVVPAADLARSLPGDVGIALNPGAEASVPVFPAGVAYLAAVRRQAGGVPIRVSVPAQQPARLISEASAALRGVPEVREARTAWLSVAGRGEGLIISIGLDDPADPAAQDAAAHAVEAAVARAGEEAGFPIDLTFPGDGEPDPVAESVAASAAPFYQRG
jgi:hypothetical protein